MEAITGVYPVSAESLESLIREIPDPSKRMRAVREMSDFLEEIYRLGVRPRDIEEEHDLRMAANVLNKEGLRATIARGAGINLRPRYKLPI